MGAQPARRHLFLIGMTLGGKSSAGRRVAQRLGMPFLDTDALVEARAGRKVADIFARDGEEAFRDLETAVLRSLRSEPPSVVATGGGLPLRPENRLLLRDLGVIVLLQAHPETLVRRAEAGRRGTAGRPLLQGDDPRARITRLYESRRVAYDIADWVVQTDHLAPRDVVKEVIRGWRYCEDAGPWPLPPGPGLDDDVIVDTGQARYAIRIEPGLIDRVGPELGVLGLRGAAFLVADDQVMGLYGRRVQQSLEGAGFRTVPITIPAGEEHKTTAVAGEVHDAMLAGGVERRDCVVALGGGVTGDLAGYAAATILRGIALIHVPTSLLAMVDSSIGGKTGVDHPRAKNMIGAFHQPLAVLVDPDTLATLPERHYRAGWAEVVKHGLILDAGLVAAIEQDLSAIRSRDPAAVSRLIRWSGRIKAMVVSQDERESGLRSLLNYGHTVGHALETLYDYRALLHGEAVAIGMHAAGAIGVAMGLLGREDLLRQNAVIAALGLPLEATVSDRAAFDAALRLDKKVAGGRNRWVLLEQIGRAVVRGDVPADAVETGLAAIVPGGVPA